jgi:hypothetical protein
VSRLAVCRRCGRIGLEDPDDVAPGVCPRCLDALMAALTAKLALYVQIAPSLEEALERIRPEMLRAGLTPAAADRFLARALAGETTW